MQCFSQKNDCSWNSIFMIIVQNITVVILRLYTHKTNSVPLDRLLVLLNTKTHYGLLNGTTCANGILLNLKTISTLIFPAMSSNSFIAFDFIGKWAVSVWLKLNEKDGLQNFVQVKVRNNVWNSIPALLWLDRGSVDSNFQDLPQRSGHWMGLLVWFDLNPSMGFM